MNGKLVEGGGWATGQIQVGDKSFAEQIEVNSRSQNQPRQYVAGVAVQFVAGFESATADEWEAFIADAGNTNITTNNGDGTYEGYRYGFNGKEKGDEISNDDYDFGARIYDGRIGRFLSVDSKEILQPFVSPFCFAGNSPLYSLDFDGNLDYIVHYIHKDLNGKITTQTYTRSIQTFEDVKGIDRTPVVINVYSEDVMVQVSPSVRQSQRKRTNIEIVEKSGLTKAPFGEETKAAGKFNYYFGLGLFHLTSMWGGKEFITAMDGRDPNTGEYLNNGQKIAEYASGLFNLITLGRGALTGDVKKVVAGWATDEFVTLASKGVSYLVENQFKWTTEETGKFMYSLADLAINGKKDVAKNLVEFVIKLGKAGADGTKAAIEINKQFGIDVKLPNDKEAANKQAVKLIETSGF